MANLIYIRLKFWKSFDIILKQTINRYKQLLMKFLFSLFLTLGKKLKFQGFTILNLQNVSSKMTSGLLTPILRRKLSEKALSVDLCRQSNTGARSYSVSQKSINYIDNLKIQIKFDSHFNRFHHLPHTNLWDGVTARIYSKSTKQGKKNL